jgi:hypothetical protein
MRYQPFLLIPFVASFAFAQSQSSSSPTWKKLQLSDRFHCEGANFADFNKDGKTDVVSGPWWYEGPDFTKKHEIYKPTGKEADGSYKPDNDYSDNFFAFIADFNADSLPDYLVYGFPGKEARVYLNPGPEKLDQHWEMKIVFDSVDNESPQFTDMDGDGKPEGVFHSQQTLGYATIDWSDPLKKWTYHPISPKGGWQRFTHGYGVGDVNGDGRADLLEAKSWWEQPADKDAKEWIRHPFDFAGGGAQMYVYDVDADGLSDVITSLNAHGWGLAWYKQKKDDSGQITFERNVIMDDKGKANAQGVRFSQLHAVDFIDINGDGLKDIITGKRWYAHGSKGDAEPNANPVLYWFELKRTNGKVEWIGHQIDDNSGVGTQVVAGDINGDKTPDIVVGNKKGTFVFLSQPPVTKTAASN